MPEANLPRALHRALKPRLPEMIRVLRRLVEAESSSLEKTAAGRCCRLLALEWRRRGARVELIPQKHRGDHLRVTWPAAQSNAGSITKEKAGGQLLVVGHYDTVYAAGTLRKMPFHIRGGKAYGPGAFDMKGGLVQALFAVDALQGLRTPLRKRIVFLWTSDEEVGSGTSRELIEREARRSNAVFVLEPASGRRGQLKTSRKAVGEAEIIAHGRAAHAGLDPQSGVNAVHELARQIARIEKWNDLRRGITVNAGIIAGGTRVNVIAERARAVLDLRATTLRGVRRIEEKLRALRPILPGAKLEVRGGFNRAPLERKWSAALFARAKKLASQMGLALGECSAGGGSDGNFTAALGIPTLDGLGAVGGGAHSSREHVLIRKMPERAALLAALLAES
jgi:glutamate carboxypeptidase